MSSNNGSGGIGFLGLLGILFIGLKLTGYIQWGWLWVLCPLWIPATVVLLVCFVVFAYGLWENM